MEQAALTVRSSEQAAVSPVLVLGLGNILLRDEGVGVRVVEALRERALPAGVELFDGGTAGVDLLDVIADRARVIVVDALAGDVEPGTVVRLTPADLDRPRQGVSLHDLGVVELLTIARRLGVAPREVVVIGVQPAEVSWGLTLSDELQALVPRIAELVLDELSPAVGRQAAAGVDEDV